MANIFNDDPMEEARVKDEWKPKYTVLVTIKVIEEATGKAIEYTGVATRSNIRQDRLADPIIDAHGNCTDFQLSNKTTTSFSLDGIITSSKSIKIYNNLPPDRFDFIGSDDE